MNGPNTLCIARQQLADAVSKTLPFTFEPLNISAWLAAALLQKAIRRGADEWALRAAATLLRDAPDRLWRRCGGIAYEDIGLADIDAVSMVTAAIIGKRFRSQIGGEWSVASFIVSRMARAAKCRAADDLLMTAELHPQYAYARSRFANMPTSDLLQVATGSNPLPERAIAAWYVAGTYWRTTRHLRPRRGEPQLLFDHLMNRGYPRVIIDLAREGFRKGAGMLAPFVAMMFPLQQTVATTEDDQFPPEAMIRDIPSWALDIFSREGRASIEAFLEGDSATATWVRTHIPPSQRIRFLGGVLFRVEGGLVRKRLRWPIGDELRRIMDFECHGPHCPDANEVLDLMRADIPLLNEVRAHVC